MAYIPGYHNRQSHRLQGYDYSKPGFYFITIVTKDRKPLFGEIINGQIKYTAGGNIAQKCWLEIPEHYPNVKLHTFIIMPEHVHGIIEILAAAGVQNPEPLLPINQSRINKFQKIIPRSIGSIVRGFKIGVTKWHRQNTNVEHVWQRNFYERIVNNPQGLHRVTRYIEKHRKA